jgi:hypothetical protein
MASFIVTTAPPRRGRLGVEMSTLIAAALALLVFGLGACGGLSSSPPTAGTAPAPVAAGPGDPVWEAALRRMLAADAGCDARLGQFKSMQELTQCDDAVMLDFARSTADPDFDLVHLYTATTERNAERYDHGEISLAEMKRLNALAFSDMQTGTRARKRDIPTPKPFITPLTCVGGAVDCY